jgi:membrane fusion protein, multidrug efflux system
MSDDNQGDEHQQDGSGHENESDQNKDSGSDQKSGDKDEQKSGDQNDDQKDGDQSDDQKSDDKKDKPSLFKRPIFWVILILVVVVVLIAATLYWSHASKFESTDDAFVDAHIVRIAPQISGTLLDVADVDNRHVEAGRLLAVIEPSSQQASVTEAQSNEKQAEAQYQQALAQVASAQAQRDQAQAQARVPLANLDKARLDLSRYENLARLDRAAVSGQQLDQARTAEQSAAADAAAAQRQVSSADAQIGVARKQVTAAKAVIEAKQALVRQAGITLGDVRLTAPVSGQVTNRQVNLGSFVSPGTQLMAIVPDRIWITANFKETQLTHMRIGDPVDIRVDAFPAIKFKGRIDSVQRGAGQAFALLPPQNATGNYVKVVQRVPVRIEFDTRHGPDPRNYPIGPGMSVEPTVQVSH